MYTPRLIEQVRHAVDGCVWRKIRGKVRDLVVAVEGEGRAKNQVWGRVRSVGAARLVSSALESSYDSSSNNQSL
jgi:hypothetical protein